MTPKELIDKLNQKGIPVPMVRNPRSGIASVSLTLVFISFNVWLVSIVGKAAGFFGGIDANQAFNMFIACSALYWSRNLNISKDKAVLDKDKTESSGE